MNAMDTNTPDGNVLAFPAKAAAQSAPAAVLGAMSEWGQIGEPQPLQGPVFTPTGRLTPLAERWQRRLPRGGRKHVWRELDAVMEEAEAAMREALQSEDHAGADRALDAWEEAAAAAIYFPSDHADDLRDRLRLLAHFCGARDPTGSYLSTQWEHRTPIERMFAVLDWHLHRAMASDQIPTRRFTGRDVKRAASNDNEAVGMASR